MTSDLVIFVDLFINTIFDNLTITLNLKYSRYYAHSIFIGPYNILLIFWFLCNRLISLNLSDIIFMNLRIYLFLNVFQSILA